MGLITIIVEPRVSKKLEKAKSKCSNFSYVVRALLCNNCGEKIVLTIPKSTLVGDIASKAHCFNYGCIV